ncbi:TetR/AcrR family transcriptional regulator [Streptomyces virginiae]|uniref:TetR/AcrR family transcriptional regulator n=1 Tax=Streptomyces virginiae TaxID=1961 RepID=UPI003427626A
MTRHPTRARIVAAALPLVVKRGTSVTTSMIARAAGVPTPAVFNAFPNKAALLLPVAWPSTRPRARCSCGTRPTAATAASPKTPPLNVPGAGRGAHRF